jgi:Tol biopolymer transport system component
LSLSRPETCPGYFGQTEDPVDLSEDGRILMFCSSVELVVLTPDGVRSATYTPPTGSYVMAAAWSPDGSRIAFIEFLGPGEPTRMSLKVIPATMSTAATIFSKELASSSSGRYAGAKNETLCWLAGVDRLVFNIPEQDRLHSHLWVIDLDGNGLTQVTSAPNTTNRSVSCTR